MPSMYFPSSILFAALIAASSATIAKAEAPLASDDSPALSSPALNSPTLHSDPVVFNKPGITLHGKLTQGALLRGKLSPTR